MNKKSIPLLPVILLLLESRSTVFADVVADPPAVSDPSDSVTPWIYLILFMSFVCIIQLIAKGMMLEKRIGRGWRIIIPFYGRYLEYKTYWKPMFYRINLGMAAFVLIAMFGIYFGENDTIIGIFVIGMLISLAVITVICVKLRLNTVEVFGYSRILGLLALFCLGFVLDCICGFSGRGKKAAEPADVLQTPEEIRPSEETQLTEEDLTKWD